MDTSPERELAELAEYHAGLFAGAAGALPGADVSTVAHGLFLLARAAERRREEWLGGREPDRRGREGDYTSKLTVAAIAL